MGFYFGGFLFHDLITMKWCNVCHNVLRCHTRVSQRDIDAERDYPVVSRRYSEFEVDAEDEEVGIECI